VRAALLDAGAIVGYLDRADAFHSAASAAFERSAAEGRILVTTWEAVSEAFTLLRSRSRSVSKRARAFAVLDWAWDSGVILLGAEPADHRRCRRILEQHRDVALSYADSLLLAVAERNEVVEILTVDGAHLPAVKLASATFITVLA
jgi:predicted nucleic acid-binding protein